ncbi:MAG: flavin reductase family protein [Cyclobacteriaceae bacterium]
MIIDPKEISVPELHGHLLSAVSPRPIALASTIDANGRVNLSPFSFFNAFGSNPPTLIFAPNRRVRDNTTKHTYENAKNVPEVVINIVSFEMVQQMSLSSTEYDKGVNEFAKAGFTEVKSDRIQPPRVGEAKVAFECKIKDVVDLGDEGGSGGLIICEIILMHINHDILDGNGKIDPVKLDTVGRLGGNWYVRSSEGLFEVEKPLSRKGMGIDQMSEKIRNSNQLTGNDLGKLGNVEQLPDQEEINEFSNEPEVRAILDFFSDNREEMDRQLHKLAKQFLEDGEVWKAWKTLLQY